MSLMDSCQCLSRFPLERVYQVWPSVSQVLFLPSGSKADVPLCSRSLTCSFEHRPTKATIIDTHTWTVMPLDTASDLDGVTVDSLVMLDMTSHGVEYSNHGATACDRHTTVMVVPIDQTCVSHGTASV